MMGLLKAALALALFMTLAAGTGCDPKIVPAGVKLPHAPAHYAACFSKLTAIPIGSLTREKVIELVARLRQSELAKSRCGKDLRDWYDTVRVAYAPKGK